MTYPGFPFPPGTPLFPSHEYINKYHQDFALHYNLLPYIALNHTVLSASWVGTPEEGYWDVIVADQDGKETQRSFDHLVVASGHNHYPRVPIFPGQDEWLRRGNGRPREILHSVFYREPQRYTDQTVVVVGSGASGRDAASQVVLYARKVVIVSDYRLNVTFSVVKRHLGLLFYSQFAKGTGVRAGRSQARDRILYTRCHRLRRRLTSIRRRRCDTGDGI